MVLPFFFLLYAYYANNKPQYHVHEMKTANIEYFYKQNRTIQSPVYNNDDQLILYAVNMNQR